MMTNLKSSRCHLAALSLPVMGREEMRRVPRFPGCVADAFRDQLNAIIDSNLFARDDDAARQARDLLESLPRALVDGHEMYSAGAGEVDQAFVGFVRRTLAGKWDLEIALPGGNTVLSISGFAFERQAQEVMDFELEKLNRENTNL
jgi:uncharacterized protein (DUF1499 family)